MAGAFAIAAFLVGLARAQAINRNLDVLRTDEATFITRRLRSYPVRARLVLQARRVLYVEKLAGYFGAENGVIPSVFDDAYLARLFRADTAEEIAERLSAAGFSHVAVGHAYDGRLGGGVGWRWIEPGRAPVVVQFFASLRVVTAEPAITVYALSNSVP